MVWDATKVDGVDGLSAAEWNTHVTDQKGHNTRHETGGTDALTALSAAILTSGTIPFARITPNTRFKIGAFTRDTSLVSGTQAITGIGFMPAACIFFAVVDTTSKFSIGMDAGGSDNNYIADSNGITTDTYSIGSVRSIGLISSAGVSYIGVIQSMDADGFTISWTKNGSPTGTATILYIAFR